jgi:hypothetical protein
VDRSRRESGAHDIREALSLSLASFAPLAVNTWRRFIEAANATRRDSKWCECAIVLAASFRQNARNIL